MKTNKAVIIPLLLLLIQPNCIRADKEPWRACLGKEISGKILMLDRSFQLSLKQNKLSGNESFLMEVVHQGDSIYYTFQIPLEAGLDHVDVNRLYTILRTDGGSYYSNNKLVHCLKECISCKTELVTKYIRDKENAGNISPVIVARGLLNVADKSELSDRLVKDLILLEIYLPILRKESWIVKNKE